MRLMRALLAHRGGASAAEFALVLPVLIAMTLGTVDMGRYMWEANQAKKATQYGARWAAVTTPVEGVLLTESFVGKTVGAVTLTQGDFIPASALGTITYTDSACTCAPGPCLSGGTSHNSTAFNAIVTRMQLVDPRVDASEVQVIYQGSGLGFAGDPNGADISPLITVRISGRQYSPITAFLLASVNMPDFRTTLTAEDLDGADSN